MSLNSKVEQVELTGIALTGRLQQYTVNLETKIGEMEAIHAQAIQSIFVSDGAQSADAAVMARAAHVNAQEAMNKMAQLTENTRLQFSTLLKDMKALITPKPTPKGTSTRSAIRWI